MGKDSVNWRKATYSNGQGDCVEVGNLIGYVAVRDTKDRDGAELAFTAAQWEAFAASLR